MDYPKFDDDDFNDIRITVFEIYPKEDRMSVFNDLITNHYYNIYMPKQNANQKTNPMNLHPWSFQFYKCNPIKTFECIIENIDINPIIHIDPNTYIEPKRVRDESLKPLPMPSNLLKADEWDIMLSNANFNEDIAPLIDATFLQKKRLSQLTEYQFAQLSKASKTTALPFLDQKLRDLIPLRPIVSNRQKEHYQRG